MQAERADQAGSNTAHPAEWTPPSWEDVVRDHSARVYRLAYRLTGNSHDAEDLTQEVFVRVFRSLPNYTPGTFEGWLHRITTNLFLDLTRRRQRIRFEGLGDDAASRLSGAEPTPSQAFDDRHLDFDIAEALAGLSPEYRAAVVLCDIEGLAYEEIADVLGVKLGTVRSRIHRGRAQLRAALEHRRPRHQADRAPVVKIDAIAEPVLPVTSQSAAQRPGGRLAALSSSRAEGMEPAIGSVRALRPIAPDGRSRRHGPAEHALGEGGQL